MTTLCYVYPKKEQKAALMYNLGDFGMNTDKPANRRFIPSSHKPALIPEMKNQVVSRAFLFCPFFFWEIVLVDGKGIAPIASAT